MLSFSMLGSPVLRKNGVPLTKFRSQKEAALLFYLAHSAETHPRELMAELLWDSSSTKQALTNLRTVLTRLRKQVGEALDITRKTVALTPENRQQVDSTRLLRALAQVETVNSAEIANRLQQALDAYQGPFLADFSLSDAPRFEEWLMLTREHIHRQVSTAYDKLAHYHADATADRDAAIATARRWLDVDPLNETAHTLLIRMLLEKGSVREAASQIAATVHLLKTELDVAPSAELQTLIASARPRPAAPPPAISLTRHNLPVAFDQFFGRKAAQHEIHARLDQPWCRLITITGQGGIGKTRLATTIAHSRLGRYPDGVWLVELEHIDEADDDLSEALAVEIATILDLRLTGITKPAEQLLKYLQHKQMMLVLDNFEHVLGAVPLVVDIVQRCENVQLLATSREALRIRAEWTIALTGLGYLTSGRDEMQSDAVAMFVARQAQQRRGELSAEALTAVRQICRLVEGLPLAIELAAALTRHATCEAVAASLAEGYDLLASSLRDVPARHRSLQVVFEMSWRTLTPALQQQLAQLAIFRSGFSISAVAEITHANQQQLTDLIDKSLLSHNPETERYSLHPVIRTYAAGKRSAEDPTATKHATYYLTLLASHTAPLQKEQPQESMRVLEPDIDNIRRAWQTGLAAQMADLLNEALTALSIYYQLRGLAYEAEQVMANTMTTAAKWGDAGMALATHAGLERARFQNRLGRYRFAQQTLRTALQWAAIRNDRWAIAMGHVWWGESLWRLGEYDTAKKKLARALTISTQIDAALIDGWCHHQLGIVHDIQSDYAVASDHLQQACAVWQRLGNAMLLSVSLNSIGLVQYHMSHLTAAQQAWEEALELCTRLDNRHLQSFLLNNLSIIATEQGDVDGAQYYLQLGLELAMLAGNVPMQGAIYGNMGENLALQNEDDAAIQYLEKSVEVLASIGEQSMVAEAKISLAEVWLRKGESDRAQALFSQALAIAKQDGFQRIECEALMGMARVLLQTDVAQAHALSAEAVSLAQDMANPDLVNRAETIHAAAQRTNG